MLVEQVRDQVYTSFSSSLAGEFTEKFDPDLWELLLTSPCDPETAVSEWLRSRCPSDIPASPTEVCGDHTLAAALKSRQFKKEQLSHQWRADKHRNNESFYAEGGHLAKSETDRVAGRDNVELFDDWASVIRHPTRASSSSTSFATVSTGTRKSRAGRVLWSECILDIQTL